MADEKDISWEYFTPQNIDAENLHINGNKQLIAQLFTNLLDNACKYSPPKSTISLSLKTKDDGSIEAIIADQGPGIPEAEHKNVFKRFHRLDSARSTEGNGLGLSLVKAVLDLHDANIDLTDNHPGLIATVSFKT